MIETTTPANKRRNNKNMNGSDLQTNDDDDDVIVSKSNFTMVRHLILLHPVNSSNPQIIQRDCLI